MFVKPQFLNYFILIAVILVCSKAQRTKDKMYDKISATSGCYRRLNSTHQIGCSSKRGGSTGVVHYCDTEKDLDFILNNGTAPPYIPILSTKLFTLTNLKKLRSTDKVSGLIVHPNDDHLEYFTHEDQCPNERFSLQGTCKKNSGTHTWNPFGTGALYMDIPFPMFYLDNTEDIVKIKYCFGKFNNFSYNTQNERSLCSLELRAFMYATTNTPTCTRRSNVVTNLNPVKFCDPLGDHNVWSSLFPLVDGTQKNNTKPKKDYKYIVVAARLDTTSLFHETRGADSPITGIVTLLSIAKLLKTMLPFENNSTEKQNVLFILFNGETYDYIGSQRLLFDLEHGTFPVELPKNNDILPIIYPENITLFVELSQLSKGEGVYAHFHNDSEGVQNFYEKLLRYSTNDTLKLVPNSLPPSSLHTFLKHNPNLPGLVLANHRQSYVNHFYNSIYDNASNIEYKYYNASEENSEVIPKDSVQQHVVDVADMVAKSLFKVLTGKEYTEKDKLDVGLVDELFHCYLEDPSCRVFKAVQDHDLKLSSPLSLYVGVDVVNNVVTSLTALTLGWFTGNKIGSSDEDCNNIPRNYAFRYYNMSESIYDLNTTMCFKVTVNTTEAVSPAFIIEDYDWSSDKYSSWAESTWADMGVRLFLRPSVAHENMTIAIGSMTMIFSFIFVYFVKSRSHILFAPPLPAEPPADC